MSWHRGTPLLSGLVARLRSTWRGFRRRESVEAEMAEEFRHHIELRTADLIRRGVPPADAARQARLEFGHVESHREDARASRGLRLFDEVRFSWLDVKLGLRILARYPGLSVISVIGMAVAIAIGAGAFSMISAMMDPTLPLPASERIVSLQNSTSNPGNPERRMLHDFAVWREELEHTRDLTAFRTVARNLIVPGATVDLVPVAEMSAAGFRVAGVAPVLGRPLLDEDESAGAVPVVVIAHEEWQRRFDGRPDIIGHPVRLGAEVHTVVGVMPEGFRFPVSHRFWVPLRLDPGAYAMGEGPSLQLFGRLAQDATREEAQAELTTIGRRMAAEYPATHGDLRPQILPYTHPFFDIDTPGFALAMRALQVAISLLLVLVAMNVAVLVYARTATRAGEITVRSALGASRKRIITQLFAEAFVLSAVAAAIGLLVAGIGLQQVQLFLERVAGDEFPFWFDARLSPAVAAYAAGLAILAGVIVGVFPALKATGQRVQAGLQQLSTRGAGAQLGRTWTALIVAQVALAVAILPYALVLAGEAVQRGTGEPAYPVDEVLVASLHLDGDPSELAVSDSMHRADYLDRAGELVRRLEMEPAVAGVTFYGGRLHGARYTRIEIEGEAEGTASVLANDVAVSFFEVLDLPVLTGRHFTGADTLSGAATAIVDRAFAEQLLGGGDVLGRRIREVRYTPAARGEPATVEEGPWREVVGVVPAHATQNDLDPADRQVYLPTAMSSVPGVGLGIRIRGAPPYTFSPRLREITASVDPLLQLRELRTGAEIERNTRQSLLFLGLMIVAVTTSVLLLSAAGIYAMMSFAVTRRRREIGIRSALGAAPRRVIGAIFARAGSQLGAGVLAGLLLAVALDRATGGPLVARSLVLVPAVSALVLVIGITAALGPARRILAVQPTDALREE